MVYSSYGYTVALYFYFGATYIIMPYASMIRVDYVLYFYSVSVLIQLTVSALYQPMKTDKLEQANPLKSFHTHSV